MFPRLGVAVVANQGGNTASVIRRNPGSDALAADGHHSITGPTGVAIDQDLGEVLVTASGANVADEFSHLRDETPRHHGRPNGLTVQQQPTSVAVDSVTHLAAVGNLTSNNVTVLSLNSSANTNTT